MSGTAPHAVPKPPPTAAEHSGPIDIVLLMKKPEAAFCEAALKRCAGELRIVRAGSVDEIVAARDRLSGNARLIGFSTSVVVPGPELKFYGGGAYNFHPGPPEYPGNRPSAFACYDQAEIFGVTFHRMVARVDSGEILDCERFPTHGMATAGALAILAYQRLARLFLNNVVSLATLNADLDGNGEIWSGRKTTLAHFDAMRRVPGDVDPVELDRRLRAFNWIYTPLPADHEAADLASEHNPPLLKASQGPT